MLPVDLKKCWCGIEGQLRRFGTASFFVCCASDACENETVAVKSKARAVFLWNSWQADSGAGFVAQVKAQPYAREYFGDLYS